MRNMFKDHLVAEALSCNSDICREIFVHCVWRAEQRHSEHVPFCIESMSHLNSLCHLFPRSYTYTSMTLQHIRHIATVISKVGRTRASVLHKARISVDSCGDVDGMIVERKGRL